MFHLYVVGVTESGPDAVRRLSEAMAARYGLPAQDLHARMLVGPVRVKSNIDRETADRYAHDLESIGARVELEEIVAVRLDSEKFVPLDDSRFAPPEDDDPNAALELAPVERARRPPVLVMEESRPLALQVTAPPVLSRTVWPVPPGAASEPVPAPRHLVARPRVRFAVGIALAIVLGFVPAHIVASLREDAAYRPIDAQVIAAQAAVDSQASYRALDALRADKLAAKRSARIGILLTTLAVWAAAGGVVAYIWFKRVPWDKLA